MSDIYGKIQAPMREQNTRQTLVLGEETNIEDRSILIVFWFSNSKNDPTGVMLLTEEAEMERPYSRTPMARTALEP